MYELNNRYQDTNGYILIYMPTHPRSFSSGSFKGYLYEHILVAEELMGRPLISGEVVHHLDKNRTNNSPENLLVIFGSMHTKLHSWLNKNIVTPSKEYEERMLAGCIRCKVCQKPINGGFIYCSATCSQTGSSKYDKPTKEFLEKIVWEKPTTEIAKDFNVSDTAISKLCKQFGITKPGRGYWQKIKEN